MSDFGLVSAACRCADFILGTYLDVPIEKATRLGTPEEFNLAVARLAAILRQHVDGFERGAIQAALATLDVDWAQTTSRQRAQLVAEAVHAADGGLFGAADSIRPPLEYAAKEVLGSTRHDVLRLQGLDIGTEFTALDERMMRFMTRSQTLYVRAEYGRRVEGLAESVRASVAEGMQLGLGRDDIAAALADVVGAELTGGTFYLEVVAGAFVGRGRSYGQISSYSDAGIKNYRVEAVLDERTSEICRLLHGRVFSVAEALKKFAEGEELNDPEALKHLNPWPRHDGHGLYLMEGKKRVNLTRRAGDIPHTDGALAAMGLGFPPYHGLCRTNTVALI